MTMTVLWHSISNSFEVTTFYGKLQKVNIHQQKFNIDSPVMFYLLQALSINLLSPRQYPKVDK